jgi:peptide/nickel transport system substrate-binding protein
VDVHHLCDGGGVHADGRPLGGHLAVLGQRPVLFPWKLSQSLDEAPERVTADRNPYYWKVDSDGRQLPYIDRVSYELVSDLETAVLKATNGDVEMQQYWVTERLADKPVFAQHQESGDYRVYDTIRTASNTMVVALNMTSEDEALREVFSSRDFRVGLSHAIDRQEIIDVVYLRQGEPWQAAPRRETQVYYDELAKQYTEYDVDLANEYLDRAGFVDRDSDDFRLGPDGDRISFRAEMIPDETEMVDSFELIRGYWREVGIDMRVDVIERSNWETRKEANLTDVTAWVGDGGLDPMLLPRWYFPADTWGSTFGNLWARWYVSGGAEGEEPPDDAKRQMEIYDDLNRTVDSEGQIDLMNELLDIAKDQFWAIGISLRPDQFGVVKNNFHNTPEVIISGWTYPEQGPTNPEQYFIEA